MAGAIEWREVAVVSGRDVGVEGFRVGGDVGGAVGVCAGERSGVL